MPSKPTRLHVELTSEHKKKIARVAIARMSDECQSDFQFLEQFRMHGVNRFLSWVKKIDRADRLDAALSRTCRHLSFHQVDCGKILNFERWVKSYQDWPLNAGLDLTWRPRRFAKMIVRLVREQLGPQLGSSQSPDFAKESRYSIPEIRGGLDLNSRVADIRLYQYLRGDKSLFDLSYLSVLGLGPTGWCVHSEVECIRAVEQLPGIIAKAKDLI